MARYIDADVLVNQMLSHYRALVDEYGERDAYVSGYDDSIDTIQGFPTADVVPRSELENLKYTLLGVMHSVDKWLDGDELEQDEVNRAATMREKTLRIVENVRGEAAKEILKKVDDVLWKHKLSGHINIDSIHNDIEKLKKEYTKGGEG